MPLPRLSISRFVIFLVGVGALFPASHAQHFPLKVSANGRYFVDQAGTPFLYHADTPWLLPFRLTLDEAREYLIHQKGLGFTTLQVQMSFHINEPNRDGQRPFADPNDFLTRNERYFDHIGRVVALADSLGLLLSVAPLWKGCCREGYGIDPDKPLQRNGLARNRWLGQYLGKRFGQYPNILWIMGGDGDPGGDRAVIEQMALGLREFAPQQLICYHAATTHSSNDLFQYAPWLGFSMVYTYYRDTPNGIGVPPEQVPQVYEVCLREYRKSDRMPFILGESQYENNMQPVPGTPQQLRRQAYWALLSGAAGHAVGTNNWEILPNWRELLRLPGLQSMKHLAALFGSIPWWTLRPDQDHRLSQAGYGRYGEADYITTAVSEDSTLAVSYFPTSKPLTVNLKALKGTTRQARWMNAATGRITPVAPALLARPTARLAPPTPGDWVLVLEGRN
jgi:hypothetical protein